MKKLLLVMAISLSVISCKKTEYSGCWACSDTLGNPIQTVCGDSEQDAFDKSGTINGSHDITTFRKYCNKK